MRLAKLTGLEIEKLEEELKEVRALDQGAARDARVKRERRMKIMKDELHARSPKKYGDERRTEITSDEGEFTIEDLIAEEDMVVTISHSGYIKRTSVSTYKKQRRGGRGLNGRRLKDEDFVEHLFIASTHDYILFFTDDGRCFWLKVHEIPQAGRAAKGKPIVNLINVIAGHEDLGDGAGARVPRDAVPALRHEAGHGEEDGALAVLQSARRRGSRRSRSRTATS